MSTVWPEISLGDLFDRGSASVQTGPFGSQLHAHNYVTVGTPVIPTEAIGRRILSSAGLPCIGEDTVQRLARHKVLPGDILFARRGVQATGLSALVTEEQAGWVCGTGAIRLRLFGKEIDPLFLSFVLSTDASIEWFKSQAVGAVMPNLNEGIIRRFMLRIPPLPTQRAIARILGALDDKIELNRRQSATLEALARAVFQSWFMDFDPVRARAAGRAPVAMDAATAALFPDAFDVVEGREVPRGWRTAPIGDVTRVVGGSTPSTTEPEFWEGGMHYWATPKDLSSLSAIPLLETERRITDAGLSQISSGLLPKGTVLLSSRAPVGYTAITDVPVAINQGFIAMVCDRELPNHYVFWWTRMNMEEIKSRANGTIFLEISKANFRPLTVLAPPTPVLRAFVKVVEPLYQKVRANLQQSRTLAALRDALLPRLLSGELRVRAAERLVKERV